MLIEHAASRNRLRKWTFFVLVSGAILATILVFKSHALALAPPAPAQQTSGSKIAEGEYAIVQQANEGAVGPFGEETYNFHETWALSKLANGQYEVTGERRFESPRDSPHADRYLVQLTRDLTVIRVTEFAQLRWRRDSGPLSCDFLPAELHCSSGGSDPAKALQLHEGVTQPYGLLWPISVFSLSGLTRQAERNRGAANPVQLFTIEQPSADNPIAVTMLDGDLRYLGEEHAKFAEQDWQAHKFSLKVPSHPEFLIWTTQKGLLLALAVEHADPHWPEEGMRLVRYQQSADF